MHTRHGLRRWVLSALLVLVAVSAALGAGHGASAADDDPYPIKGYESAEDFKANCEAMGGTFSTDEVGQTYCRYADGSETLCNSKGQGCWRVPARLQRPDVELTYDEPAPMYESPPAADAGLRLGRGEFTEAAPMDAAVVADTP